MESFFTKTSTEREVAHVYEHIFITALDEFLISKSYLPYLDYTLGGDSMRGEIELSFKTSSATLEAKRMEFLESLDKQLRFTSDRIDAAIEQISAERRCEVAYVNPAILEKMMTVRRRKWRQGVAIDIDLDDDKVESEYLRYAENTDISFYNIPIEVGYKGKDVELGLFLCRIVMEIFCRVLRNEFSCCYDGASDEVGDNYVSLATILIKPDKNVIRKEMIEKRAAELMAKLKKPRQVLKIQRELRNGPLIPIGIEGIEGERLCEIEDWSSFANLILIKKVLNNIKIRSLEITTE